MADMKPPEHRDILAAFQISRLQSAVTLDTVLKDNGLDISFVKAYLREKSEENNRQARERAANRNKLIIQHGGADKDGKRIPTIRLDPERCPECDHGMRLSSGDSPSNCQWTCPICRKGIYVDHSVEEEMKRVKAAGEIPNDRG